MSRRPTEGSFSGAMSEGGTDASESGILEAAVASRAVGPRTLQPFLRWPGGKRFLVSYLLEHVPATFGRYFEPFLGGGALFFALLPEQAVLSDTNRPLIECYLAVRDSPELVMRRLRQLPNTKEDYYRIRASRPRTPHNRAARLIYLSALAFNGIYRENLKGEFNVPYGGKVHRRVAEGLALAEISKCLARAELRSCDFEEVLEGAERSDFVYLDPPYRLAHENNGFVKYNSQVFSWEDQRRLASAAQRLALKGCHVVVSNAHHASIRELYGGFRLHRLDRPSRVAAHAVARGVVSEYVLTSWPP